VLGNLIQVKQHQPEPGAEPVAQAPGNAVLVEHVAAHAPPKAEKYFVGSRQKPLPVVEPGALQGPGAAKLVANAVLVLPGLHGAPLTLGQLALPALLQPHAVPQHQRPQRVAELHILVKTVLGKGHSRGGRGVVAVDVRDERGVARAKLYPRGHLVGHAQPGQRLLPIAQEPHAPPLVFGVQLPTPPQPVVAFVNVPADTVDVAHARHLPRRWPRQQAAHANK